MIEIFQQGLNLGVFIAGLITPLVILKGLYNFIRNL